MSEAEVLELPIDKFELYTQAVLRHRKVERMQFAIDVAGGVSAMFSKDGLKKHMKAISED